MAFWTGNPFTPQLRESLESDMSTTQLPIMGVFHRESGALLGIAAASGGEQTVGGSGTNDLSGVSYDGSNRATGYQVGSITYTITYPNATTILATSSNGQQKKITLDGSGRIVKVENISV